MLARRCGTLVLVLAAPAVSSADAQARDQTATALSRQPLTDSQAWRRYVLDSTSAAVGPRAITVEGDSTAVTNLDGLKAQDGRVTTIRATGRGTPRLILDLGVNVGGKIEVGVTAGSGVTVRLAYSEARRYLTEDGDMTPASSFGANDDPDGRSDTFTAPGPVSFVSPGVRGAQRWVLLQLDGEGEVSIDYVRVRVGHLRPVPDDYAGRFVSSDDVVNRVWWGSAYTFNVAAFRDEQRGGNLVVTDAGKRDRLVWLGDLAIENLMGQYGLRQAPGIVRDSIEMFSCQQYPDGYIQMFSEVHAVCPEPGPPDGADPGFSPVNPFSDSGAGIALPEYTAWWVIATAEYAYYRGDDAFLRKMLPVIRRALDYFRAHRRDGVFVTERTLSAPYVINWHPFDTADGVDGHTQAVWYRALLAAAQVERRVGDDSRAPGLEAEAKALKEAAIARLWDEAAGAMLLNSSDPMRTHGYDAQVEGVLSGLLDGERAAKARQFVETKLMTKLGPLTGESDGDPYMSRYISPFIASDDVLGRFKAGDGAAAMGLIRRLYGFMATHDPASTMWEKLTAGGDPFSYAPNGAGAGVIPNQLLLTGAGSTSLAHPWAGGAMPALSAYVAGLQPGAPGWNRWLVAPQTVDLRWAQERVATPRGTLASRWRRGPGDRSFRLTVLAPRGTRGTVAVPLVGRSRVIARDGRIVWRNGRPTGGARAVRAGDAVVFTQRSRRSTYAWVGGRKPPRSPAPSG